MRAFPNFKTRSTQAELMDDISLSEQLLRDALGDIRLVNRVLGGDSISLEALKPFLQTGREGPLHILDVGCGNGEFLRNLAGYCRKNQANVQLLGWDMNPRSLELGRQLSSGFGEIRFEQKDILQHPALPEKDMVVICNLFLHHFTDLQVLDILKGWLGQGCQAIVINDLQRNPIAYYLFRFFGVIFMKSPIARHDGLVSIQRGFARRELEAFSSQLGPVQAEISWKWAFRYLWVLKPKCKE